MSADEAAQLLTIPGVRGVYPKRNLANQYRCQPWFYAARIPFGKAPVLLMELFTKGEGLIAGILDTGINMDHPSFADIGGDLYDHTNPLGEGVYLGLCDTDPRIIFVTIN